MPDITWNDICAIEQITPGTGVAALVDGRQLAIVRHMNGSEVFAVSNFDPFSNTFVIARGIVGDRNGIPKITSPMYKQSFDLRSGTCLDDPTVALEHFETRLVAGRIQVAIGKEPRS